MNLLNLPFLNGYKTAIAGWALFIGGLGSFLVVVGGCLSGSLDLQGCYAAIQPAFQDLTTAFVGLGILGVGHKLEKQNDSL